MIQMRCCRKLRQEEELCPVSPVIIKNSDISHSPQCRGSLGASVPLQGRKEAPTGAVTLAFIFTPKKQRQSSSLKSLVTSTFFQG